MLGRLGVDYIDMVYLHQPVGNYVEGYKALEKELKKGRVHAIGISNTTPDHIMYGSDYPDSSSIYMTHHLRKN